MRLETQVDLCKISKSLNKKEKVTEDRCPYRTAGLATSELECRTQRKASAPPWNPEVATPAVTDPRWVLRGRSSASPWAL